MGIHDRRKGFVWLQWQRDGGPVNPYQVKRQRLAALTPAPEGARKLFGGEPWWHQVLMLEDNVLAAHEYIVVKHKPEWGRDGPIVFYGEQDMKQLPVAVTPEGVTLLCHLTAYTYCEGSSGWEDMAKELDAEAKRRKGASEAAKEPPQDEWPGVFQSIAGYLHTAAIEITGQAPKVSYPECLARVAQCGYDMHQRLIPLKSLKLVMMQWNWRRHMGLDLPTAEAMEGLTDGT